MRLLFFVIFVCAFGAAAIIFVDLPPFGGYLVAAGAVVTWSLASRLFPSREAPEFKPAVPVRASDNSRTLVAVVLSQAGVVAVLLPSFLLIGLESKLVWFGIFPACFAATFVAIYLAIRADRSRAAGDSTSRIPG